MSHIVSFSSSGSGTTPSTMGRAMAGRFRVRRRSSCAERADFFTSNWQLLRARRQGRRARRIMLNGMPIMQNLPGQVVAKKYATRVFKGWP
jgi:hypothetical protein